MGRFTTGVTVVTTTAADGEAAGMTVNSLTSVSLVPPLISLCIDRESDMLAALDQAESFVVNVLSSDQEALSRRFAESRSDRFNEIGYRRSTNGHPVLDGCLAHLECRRQTRFEAGDHIVFVEIVTDGATGDGHPLVFYRGGYTSLESS